MNKCKLPDNLRKFCLTSVIFLIDTVIGTLYTLYFVYFWFHNEATEKRADVPKVAVESSQSATELRELFVIISTTIAVTALRFYFTLVILSFAKALLRFSNQDVVDEPVFESGYKGNIKRFFYGLEVRSKDGLLRLLR